MEEAAFDGSREKPQVVAPAAKKLARSGSKINAVARSRSTPGHGRHARRWSASSTDLDIETPPAVTTLTPTAAATTAVLGRSYSTTAVVAAVVDDGGVKRQEQDGEGEQRQGRRCGAGARLSRKIKEHRARFYIVRRCVAMLVCWRDADD